MRCILASHTDRGKRKKVNQDMVFLRGKEMASGQKALLAVVCDGMGGFDQGELASFEMIHMFSEWLEAELPKLGNAEETENFEDALFESWEILLQTAHQMIRSYGELHGIRLGTTATAMLFMKERYYTVHVGDSRAYQITNQIIRLTQDQNVANIYGEKVRYLTHARGKKKASSILLQGIGASKAVCPVYDSGELRCNAVYMLCSDGFLNRTDEEELLSRFAPAEIKTKEKMKLQTEAFVRMLRERGENDDISVLLVRTTCPKRDKEV